MATTDLTLSAGQPDDRRIRISAVQREFIAFALWVGVTFVQFRGDELLLYPLALYFAVRAWQERDAIFDLMTRSWPILLFPLWCLISPIWAVEPLTAFKLALYLLLTMIICYHVVLHLGARQIMWAVFMATGIAGVLNFLLGVSSGDYAWALFPHKNRMGINMVVLWVVSMATALDNKSPRPVRLAAVMTTGLSAFLVTQSDSATAILLMIATGGIGLSGAVLLRGGIWRPNKLALICLVLSVTAALASVVVSSFKGDPVTEVLDYFGKDSTLTGRTELWEYAEAQIRERPILGVGAGGFWRYQVSPLVQRIYEEFYKNPWDQFNFHNSYYEIAVHQGLIGLALAVPAILWALFWTLRGAFTVGSMPRIFFLTAAAAVLARSMTEADFFKPFVLFHMLLWIGALSATLAIRGRRARPDA